MAKILLVRFDEVFGKDLADLLRLRRHNPDRLDDPARLGDSLLEEQDVLDLVVLDVSSADAVCRSALATLREWRRLHGDRPSILCVSTVNRGPQFELEIEQKGARFVYA